jgi:transposase
MGWIAKTDAIDARLLALCGEKVLANEPIATTDLSSQQWLKDMMQRREQLKNLRHAECCRYDKQAQLPPEMVSSIERCMEYAAQELDAVETAIQLHIRQNADLMARATLLQSMKGVGPWLSAAILAYLPEIGTVRRNKIAAITGLAPYCADSGNHRGARHIKGGRSLLREFLFMGATSAIRTDTHWKKIYQDLRNKGKPYKVALVAIMRKMISILNQMVRKLQPYSTEILR